MATGTASRVVIICIFLFVFAFRGCRNWSTKPRGKFKPYVYVNWVTEYMNHKERKPKSDLLHCGRDIVQSTYHLIDSVEYVRQNNLNTPHFEIGYLMYSIFEKYRKMIDKYNTTHTMRNQLWIAELVMYLEEVENHYWEIEHMGNMLHEIERKYNVSTDLKTPVHVATSQEKREADVYKQASAKIGFDGKPVTKSMKKFQVKQYILDKLYADQIENLQNVFNDSIYKELSWSVRILLLKSYLKDDDMATSSSPALPGIGEIEVLPTVPIDAPIAPGGPDAPNAPNPPDAPNAPNAPSDLPNPERRVPGIAALVIKRRQEDELEELKKSDDDKSMRLQLFRLMYETIRDSDLKCKRAEMIRAHYDGSPVIEIGYLMGDVMDKFNTMTDISSTLTRLYNEWKPIEHLNAYEQISSQAIEINHLIDMIIGIEKKQPASRDKSK